MYSHSPYIGHVEGYYIEFIFAHNSRMTQYISRSALINRQEEAPRARLESPSRLIVTYVFNSVIRMSVISIRGEELRL